MVPLLVGISGCSEAPRQRVALRPLGRESWSEWHLGIPFPGTSEVRAELVRPVGDHDARQLLWKQVCLSVCFVLLLGLGIGSWLLGRFSLRGFLWFEG